MGRQASCKNGLPIPHPLGRNQGNRHILACIPASSELGDPRLAQCSRLVPYHTLLTSGYLNPDIRSLLLHVGVPEMT